MTKLIKICLAALLLSSCSESLLQTSVKEDKPLSQNAHLLDVKFELKYGQKIVFEQDGVTVKFDKVLMERRCPTGVTCVWAGNAKIAILFNKNSINLNTHYDLQDEVVISDYKIKLISLFPYPHVNKKIEKEEYVVTLKVIEVGE